MALRSLFLMPALCAGVLALAQCGPVISTFPYSEGFETDPAWTNGGIADDWAWGTPAHPLINSAGGGAKSWCAGGLTGQFYEFDAQSWLMSPCFDFSALARPWISLKIFWETERQYDGAVLQYSLDQGITWDNVGAYGDPEDCLNANWFNEDNVTNLDEASPKHGWSGRLGATQGSCSGGQGSGGWLEATHCMNELAGEPSVRFRFLFGSGSVCNSFDGIGIDDILIQDSPLPVVDFDYTCDGNSVSFTSAITGCATGYTWDFGDPGSGANNNATGPNPVHLFTGPGSYTVVLTATGPCAPAVVHDEVVQVLAVDVTATSATCGAANGSLQAAVTSGTGPFTYDWEPGTGSNALLTGLLPGDYSVTVSAPNACATTVQAVVDDAPSTLSVSIAHTDVSCGGAADGSATAQVSGGVAVSYAWQPTGGNGTTASNLSGGDYTVTVADADGCETTEDVTIAEAAVLTVSIDPEVVLCLGATLVLEPVGAGGVGPYSYNWDPAGPEVSPAQTTTFNVSATDAAGCTSAIATITVNVGAAIVPTLSVNETSGCSPHCVSFNPGPSGMSAYAFAYGDGATGPDAAHCYMDGGLFDVTLTVTDDNGCSGTAVFPALVEAYQRPVAAFHAPSTLIITDNPLRVADASSGGNNWLWDFDGASGDDTIPSPLVDFPSIGCYTLEQVVSNDLGCADTARAEVCVENEFSVFAPNAFTPNGDGFNETFFLVTSVRSPEFFELRVFDRWGEEVFVGTRPDEVWTADKAIDGLYAWNLSMRDSEGKLRESAGHVLLLR